MNGYITQKLNNNDGSNNKIHNDLAQHNNYCNTHVLIVLFLVGKHTHNYMTENKIHTAGMWNNNYKVIHTSAFYDASLVNPPLETFNSGSYSARGWNLFLKYSMSC